MKGATLLRTLCTLALLAVALPAGADPLSLASRYEASGSNPDGSKYTGTASVKVISDASYTIVWKIGGSIYKDSACA
jgi:hypothetical protein